MKRRRWRAAGSSTQPRAASRRGPIKWLLRQHLERPSPAICGARGCPQSRQYLRILTLPASYPRLQLASEERENVTGGATDGLSPPGRTPYRLPAVQRGRQARGEAVLPLRHVPRHRDEPRRRERDRRARLHLALHVAARPVLGDV